MQTTRDVFSTVRSEGSLLPPDLLRRIAAGDEGLGGLAPADYHLVGEKLNEAVNRSWGRVLAAWSAFREAAAKLPSSDPGTSVTRERWLLPLFSELGYGRLQASRAVELEGQSYAISHTWQLIPIHLVGFRVDLDKRTAGVAGASRVSPHGLVQDFLNRSPEHLWGILSNGNRLRVLRDSASLVRQAYVEFDLESMMEGQVYSDFVLLWLVCHQSRVEGEQPAQTWLERWSQLASEQGTRALERLRAGVQQAIEQLGQGFLRERRNEVLREALRSGELTPQDYYRQLLRLVYRLLFLLVAEDRDLLFRPGTPEATRALYRNYYSMARLRRLAEKRRGSAHVDLWRGLLLVWSKLTTPEGCAELGLPPFSGFLWAADTVRHLVGSDLPNADLLEALRDLAFTLENDVRRPVDFRNMGPEELGSVYEALLELHPELNAQTGAFRLKVTGEERHATGSHYTPRRILQRVLDFALTPQIDRCLKAPDPAAALLNLRVLDPACGSGHFLIAAAHRIARAHASVRTGEIEPAPEQLKASLREVIARCLYGVDYNPMAVELCKIALWLEALEPGRPLSFLDHHIRVGNSLIGVPLGTTVARNRAEVLARRDELGREIETVRGLALDLSDIERAKEATTRLRALEKDFRDCVYDSWADAIPDAAFRPVDDDDRSFASRIASANKKARAAGQYALGAVTVSIPEELVAEFAALGSGAEQDVAEVTIRAAKFDQATRHLEYQHAKELADAWSAAWFWPLRRDGPPPPTQSVFLTLQARSGALDAEVAAQVHTEAERRRFFHYEIAFPEVFTTSRGGFDLVLGNPPYLGGTKISGAYGARVLKFFKANHPAETRGREDLAAYFLRRGFDLLRPDGDICFITTNSIGQGDTRAAGLDPIVRAWGGSIANAVSSEPWEGDAAVFVSIIHVRRGAWHGARSLDGAEVTSIAPDLSAGAANQDPAPLKENDAVASEGSSVYGDGFFLTSAQRDSFVSEDDRNADVIFPAVGAREAMGDLSTGFDRWVINFGEMPIEEARTYRAPFERLEALVMPERAEQKRESLKKYWWMYNEPRTAFYRRLAAQGLQRVIVIPKVSKSMMPVFLPAGMVYTDALNVIASDDDAYFGLLCSAFHWHWAAKWCTTMKSDPRYTVGRCFRTFPGTSRTEELADAGRRIDQLRHASMRQRGIGLTDLYNLLNDQARQDADVVELRNVHASLDCAAARAYGWADLISILSHGHHLTERFGVRWTVAPEAQREIVARLLTLNLQRWDSQRADGEESARPDLRVEEASVA